MAIIAKDLNVIRLLGYLVNLCKNTFQVLQFLQKALHSTGCTTNAVDVGGGDLNHLNSQAEEPSDSGRDSSTSAIVDENVEVPSPSSCMLNLLLRDIYSAISSRVQEELVLSSCAR